jgi:hypothetical protein
MLGRRVGHAFNRDFEIGYDALLVDESCDVKVDRQIAGGRSTAEDPDWKRPWSND